MASDTPATDVAHRITNSAIGGIIRTIVMPALMAAALFLGSNYLTKLDQAIAAINARQDKIEDAVALLGRQVAAIEAGRAAASKARDNDIEQIFAALDRVNMKVDSTVEALATKVDASTAAVAGLSAKVEILLARLTRASVPADPDLATR